MKLVTACVVVLTTMAVSGVLRAEPTPAASPWQDTDLNFDFINERLNTTACQRSETAFLSCIGAVQSLLDAHGGRLRLVPARDLLEISKPAEIRKRFDKVAIVEGWGPRFLDDGNALALLRDRAQEILRWRDHYPVRTTDALDFSAIRRWLLAEIVDHRRAADVAAAAINGYLRVSDAHARIVPAPIVRGSLSGRQGGRGTKNSASATYTGIGASIQGTSEAAIVTSILRDGPAAKAGLRVQDVILAVDGELLTDLPPSSVVSRLRGPAGSGVQLVGIEPDRPALAQPDAGSAEHVVLREEDMFPTALPPEPGEWIQPRPESVAALAECVSEQGLAEKRWKRDTKQRQPTDHALFVAQDHLTCILQRRIF